jgi:membrane-associated phospholipid phosphatase
MSYKEQYERWTVGIRASTQRTAVLRIANQVLTGLFYAVYPVLLAWMAGSEDSRLLRTITIPAVSFLILTLIRRRINAPRPCEASKIIPLIRRDKPGESMPSRHVFSAAIIAMAWLSKCPPAGIALLTLTVLSAVIRVLGGVHYPRDVAVGFAVGILTGLLLL